MTGKVSLLVTFWMFMLVCPVCSEDTPPTWIPSPEIKAAAPWATLPDEVYLGGAMVAGALGRILLIRKGSEFCALKFTNTWLGRRPGEHYTSYEYYYQGDGSGEFSKENVKSGKGEFFYPGRTVYLGHPSYLPGRVDTIRFGKIKIEWTYTTVVRFRGNEVAPTPWTSITEVNLKDPRIRWYRKDRGRERTTMHIDQLWPRTPGDMEEETAKE